MKSLLSLLRKAYPYTYSIDTHNDLESFLMGESEINSKENIVRSLQELQIPTYIIHGEKDSGVPVNISKGLESEVTNQQVHWVYVEAGHSISSYPQDVFSAICSFVTG